MRPFRRKPRTRVALSSDGRPPVETYDARELHRLLVTDACAHHATDLLWAAQAYVRIGEQTRRGAERAFQDVLDEVEARTGVRRLPVASGRLL